MSAGEVSVAEVLCGEELLRRTPMDSEEVL